MFPYLRPGELATETIDDLVHAMSRRRGGVNYDIPAGYTYFAQFVDHDLTFDPTTTGQRATGGALVNLRTPRFDLDSLYGGGPADQPYLYDWGSSKHPGVKLLVGRHTRHGLTAMDLPRNQQGRALIGDPRNDEHLIIAQLHLLFIRFHNKVVDHIRDEEPALDDATVFEKAQQLVRWHYQWIVAHDFLTRLMGDDHRQERYFAFEEDAFIPLEFAAAAYRFGHSMVRLDYTLRDGPDPVPIFVASDHPAEVEHLGGFRRLPPLLAIDWAFFFKVPGNTSRDPPKPQPSRLIDTNFAEGLFKLPAGVSRTREPLPRLNLLRGCAHKLPAGDDVARALGERPLTGRELLLDDLPTTTSRAVRRSPPLWYYILCEAQSEGGDKGKHLGPVGRRIVRDVLLALLDADPTSYVNQEPTWKPTLLPRACDGDFTMPDLIRFTLGDATDPFPARR
jgi:Animal haem peroxidase